MIWACVLYAQNNVLIALTFVPDIFCKHPILWKHAELLILIQWTTKDILFPSKEGKRSSISPIWVTNSELIQTNSFMKCKKNRASSDKFTHLAIPQCQRAKKTEWFLKLRSLELSLTFSTRGQHGWSWNC